MITFETENSIYSITMMPNGLLSIEKTAEINPKSQFNVVGQSRMATGFHYNSTSRMFTFYMTGGREWHTSKVVRLL